MRKAEDRRKHYHVSVPWQYREVTETRVVAQAEYIIINHSFSKYKG